MSDSTSTSTTGHTSAAESPKYPVREAMYEEKSFGSLADVELAIRRLIDEADLFRFVDAEGRAHFLNLGISLTRAPEFDTRSPDDLEEGANLCAS